jgi:HD-like signal output (HDOD) protein
MSLFKSLRVFRAPSTTRETFKSLEQPVVSAAVADEKVGQELLDAGEVDTRAIGPLAKVPAFGPAAITVLRQFDRDDVSIPQISKTIASDTAMTSQLLALANSPLFGNNSYITKLDQAILLLGVQRTKALAATIAMQALASGSPKRSLVRRIWRHSVATAIVAEAIAPCYSLAPETANVAGILHDLGRFGMLAAYKDPYAVLVTKCHEDVPAILEAECQTCGMDHTRAGSLLGRSWRIPEIFRLVVGLHHDPPEGTALSNLIQLACGLADCFSFSAIAYERRRSLEETAVAFAPAEFHERILGSLDNMERRITDRMAELDF